ncbi:hypothetical protein GCM10010193_02000 [Kitasatospora atroaurantiaca]
MASGSGVTSASGAAGRGSMLLTVMAGPSGRPELGEPGNGKADLPEALLPSDRLASP